MDIRLIFLNYCWISSEGRFLKFQARFWLYASNPARESVSRGQPWQVGRREGLEKLIRVNPVVLVPQTDTGGRVEYTKVYGRTLVQELGKKARRNFGICLTRSCRKACIGSQLTFIL